jgi:hypothetical protein
VDESQDDKAWQDGYDNVKADLFSPIRRHIYPVQGTDGPDDRICVMEPGDCQRALIAVAQEPDMPEGLG